MELQSHTKHKNDHCASQNNITGGTSINLPIRIGMLTPHNPFDRNSFSGTIFYMRLAIAKHPDLELHIIGEHLHQSKAARYLINLSRRLGSNIAPLVQSLYDKLFAYLTETELRKRTDIDVVIAPVASATLAMYKHIKELPPVILITDATPRFIEEFYNLKIPLKSIERERKALLHCSKVIYSSKFMADRARSEFPNELKFNNYKISAIPFGLNSDIPPTFYQQKSLKRPIELLFVGKDWTRKGGDIALATCRILRNLNIDCKLTIIGCEPIIDENLESPHIEIHAYLDKNNPFDRKQFERIQNRSHFLLLPTRGDCTPMVIAEANAYGTPAICTDVGGISSLIEDGINGKLMDLTDTEIDYAKVIFELIQNPESYLHLSCTSRQVFEEKLNWQAWSSNFSEVAQQALNERPFIPNTDAIDMPNAGPKLTPTTIPPTESIL